jgi:hypothetical protein
MTKYINLAANYGSANPDVKIKDLPFIPVENGQNWQTLLLNCESIHIFL